MNKLHLSVDGTNFKFETELTERLTIVIGNSGVGKTSLFDALTIDSSAYTIDCDLEIVDLYNRNYAKLLGNVDNMLVIADDQIFTSGSYIMNIYNNNTTVWFLIFARDLSDLVGGTGLNHSNDYKIYFDVRSYRELKYYENDSVKHYLDYVYEDDCDIFSDSVIEYDYSNTLVMCEDSGSGFEMLSNMFRCEVNVFSAVSKGGNLTTGRDIIFKCIKSLDFEVYTTIILFIDMASFGCYIDKVVRFLSLYGYLNRVIIQYEYRSFEYLLLCSNKFSKNSISFDYDRNKFFSFEDYCEELLRNITNNSVYKYVHNTKLKSCWYIDCGAGGKCPVNRALKCNEKIIGNKLVSLFIDTKFEYLLYVMILLK